MEPDTRAFSVARARLQLLLPLPLFSDARLGPCDGGLERESKQLRRPSPLDARGVVHGLALAPDDAAALPHQLLGVEVDRLAEEEAVLVRPGPCEERQLTACCSGPPW